jgi:hypothetical protein
LLDCGAPHAAAGVGGVDSWGARPLPQHLPTLDVPRAWAFRLKVFGLGGCGQAEAQALATQALATQASSPGPPRKGAAAYAGDAGAGAERNMARVAELARKAPREEP